MSIAEKLVTIAENQHKVYRAGQRSMVDEDKIIEKTVSGGSSVTINDLSEIPHTVSVSLSAPLVPQFGGLLEGGYFEDTDFSFVRSSVFEVPERGIYTFALKVEDKSKCEIGDAFYGDTDWDGTTLPGFFEFVNDHTIRAELMAGKYRIFISDYYGLKAKDILSATLEMGTEVTLPEQASPDLSGVEVRVKGEDSEQIYFADENGFAEVKSLSPKMEISTENEDISITATYHQSYNIHRFWETYQMGGKRTDYSRFCSQDDFNDETYNPIYPITVHNAYIMFSYINKTNLVTDTKVPIIVSGYFNYCFNESPIKIVRSIDFTNCTSMSAPFYLARELEEITVVGTVKVNLEFQYSKKLNRESLISIINALYDFSSDTSGTTHKISLAKESVALLTEEEKATITSKGWTIST